MSFYMSMFINVFIAFLIHQNLFNFPFAIFLIFSISVNVNCYYLKSWNNEPFIKLHIINL